MGGKPLTGSLEAGVWNATTNSPSQLSRSVAEGSLAIINRVLSSTERARVPFSPPWYSPDFVLWLCVVLMNEWNLVVHYYNNIKCHVSLNLQTWSSSLQLREWFLHVILNALCSSRVLIAVQSIVQWPSSGLSMFGIRWKYSECSLL